MRFILWSWPALLLMLFAGASAKAADIEDLDIEVTTDREAYAPGDTLVITVTQCNPTDEVITQRYGCPGCHDEVLLIDAEDNVAFRFGLGGILVVVTETWQPGECKTIQRTWEINRVLYDDYEGLEAGNTYRARHIFHFGSPFRVTDSAPFGFFNLPVPVPSLSKTGAGLLAALLALAAVRIHRRRVQLRAD